MPIAPLPRQPLIHRSSFPQGNPVEKPAPAASAQKPVDRADTYAYSIPAPNADGSQGHPQYQRLQATLSHRCRPPCR